MLALFIARGTPMPYSLFSQTKITGSFQSWAKFIASWNSPMSVEASPKKTMLTRPSWV